MLMIFRQETPADLAALWTIALSMVRSDVGACLYVDDYDGSRCVRVIHAIRNETHQLYIYLNGPNVGQATGTLMHTRVKNTRYRY